MIGVQTGLQLWPQIGGLPPQAPSPNPNPAPAPTPAALPVAAAARWHPAFSAITLAQGRVVSASDIAGTAPVSDSGTGVGPQALIDGTGRPFWRFERSEYLSVAQDLALSSQDCAIFMVGRFHRVFNKAPIFSFGSVAADTARNTIRPALEVSTLSQSGPLLRSFSYPRDAAFAGSEWMVPGAQMQVVGMTGRAAAAGGTRLWINERSAATTQPYNVVNIAGAEIGRYSYLPGAAGSWGAFDLYEMIVCDRALTDAEGDAMTVALIEHYSIPAVTGQIVLEGDSIMQGTGDVTSGIAADMIVSEPGAGHIAPDWRVVNMASSGSRISNLTTRRDRADGWAALTLPAPARNVAAFEIGRNDMTFGNQTSADHYTNTVDYIATPNDGLLDRGWEVRVMANIASSYALQPEIETFRTLLRDPAFLTDTGTGAGQPHDGQLQVINTDQIEDAGQMVFADSDDAVNTTYYAGDATHPAPLGARVRITGGQTPQNGVAYGL